MPMICMEMPYPCCRSLRSTGRGVRPAQLKSIFERPPTAAAAGEENQDPQAAGTLSDAACCESQGGGLTGEDVGLGAEHAPARQIVSSGMIWQVIHDACRDGCIMIAFCFAHALEQVPEALSGVNERELQKEFDVIAGAVSLIFSLELIMTPTPTTPQLCLMT